MHTTSGIVLRSIKYGETSLITTMFTRTHGVQGFMMQGVRSTRSGMNRVGLLQPGILLDIVMQYQPQKTLQRIKEYQVGYLYNSIQQDVIKNTVALFSIEVLLRLLPEHAPFPELFDAAWTYFITLDSATQQQAANFPLFFVILCSRQMGYELTGGYSPYTPYLNLQEGGFSSLPPSAPPYMTEEEGAAMQRLLQIEHYSGLESAPMSASMRLRLLQWYIHFLQTHTQYMGNIKSLAVLKAILH